MICDPDPCECRARKAAPPRKAKAAPPPVEPEPVVAPAPQVDLRAKMKAAAAAAPPLPTRSLVRKPVISEKSDEELMWHEAVLSVGTLLHSDEREKYAGVLNTRLTSKEKARAWRARAAWTQKHSL